MLLLYSSFTTGWEGGEHEGQARGPASPARCPQGSQYLGGGFDEPLFLFQGGDNGDAAHRLVGVLLVLGDTHDQESFLRSATCQAKPGFPREPSEPLCQGHPLLVEGGSGNRNCQLASRTPFPENLKSRYQGVEAGSWALVLLPESVTLQNDWLPASSAWAAPGVSNEVRTHQPYRSCDLPGTGP